MGTYVKAIHETVVANGTGLEFGYFAKGVGADGRLMFHCSGDFGGGTLTVQFLGVDGNWKSFSTSSFSADATKVINAAVGMKLRVILAGATAPSIYYEFRLMTEMSDNVFFTS